MRTTGTLADSAREPARSGAALDALLVLSRICLGWYMFSAGFDKVQGLMEDGLGSFYASNAWQRRAAILPSPVSLVLGYAWPWLEITSGTLLFVGLMTRAMAALIAWIVLSIGIALLFTGELLPRHHTMVMVPFALLLCVLGSGPYSVDSLLRRRKGMRSAGTLNVETVP